MFAELVIGVTLIAASALFACASGWVSLLAAMVVYSGTSDALVGLATGTATWSVLRLLRRGVNH